MPEALGLTPVATVERLSVYLRTLEEVRSEGKEYISSKEIGERNGFSPAQVRKDLSCFGNFGRKGKGYQIDILLDTLREILGVNQRWNTAIMGLGYIGKAFANSKTIAKSNFDIQAIFDIDEKKTGKKYNGIPVFGIDDLPEIAEKMKIQIAIISVPSAVAKLSIQRVLSAGIPGILNFTEARIPLGKNFVMKNMNLAGELETIAYFLSCPECSCKDSS